MLKRKTETLLSNKIKLKNDWVTAIERQPWAKTRQVTGKIG